MAAPHIEFVDDDDEGVTEIGGGQAVPEPIAPEHVAEAVDGSLAASLRARYEASRARTKEFDVPGWEGGLIVVARPFRDRKAFQSGIRNEAFIARSTEKLLYVDDDGQRHEIPGGWGPELARMIGVESASASDLVAMVLDNPIRVDTLASQMLAWMAGVADDTERGLGE